MDPKVCTHYWLRHSGQEVFHAYLSTSSGTASICGRSPQIVHLKNMDIPGDRSKCCTRCFTGLYGFNPDAPLLPKELR